MYKRAWAVTAGYTVQGQRERGRGNDEGGAAASGDGKETRGHARRRDRGAR